jgi:DNA-binding IclR family transcriptional regulator
MMTSEDRLQWLPPELLLSPLPQMLNQTRRMQARVIPTEEARSQLLLWLLHHPLQRSEDLQLALGVSASTLHRILTSLEAQGEIEYVQQMSRWYHLSNQDMLAAAAQEHAEVKALARTWEADERGLLSLLPRLPQLAVMQELVNGLARYAPRMLAYEDGTLSDIAWSWRRDLAHRFLTHAREASYQADAALCFYRYPSPTQRQTGHLGHFFACLLLLHRLTDDDQAIRERVVALLRYRESRRAYYTAFPAVLVVTETVRERDRWHRQAQEAAHTLHLQKPLVGAITQLVTQEGTITSSWPLPWQHLGETGSCRLQEMIIPMPLEAVPPDILIPRVEMGQPRMQKRQVLTGHFQTRAEALDVAGETSDELLALLGGVLLRPRYVDLLHLLYRAPLLAASEIVDVSEETEGTLPTVIRYLQQLQRWGCLQRIDSTSGVRWLLTRRGVQVLARMDQIDARTLIDPEEDRQRGITQFVTFLEHTAGVYRCLAPFGRAAKQRAHHRLLWWEVGASCEHHYQSRGQWLHVRPDALFSYLTETASHLAWVEYDRATEAREALVTKFQTYQTFLISQQWRKAGLSRLPTLLIVVSSPTRRQIMRDVVREVMGVGAMRVRLTTMPHLQNRGPQAAIWEQLVPIVRGERRMAAFEE